MKITTHSLAETQAFASDFLASLKPREEATVLALSGDLGSGKTSFTQGVAKALGISGDITSPTFVIEKIYDISANKFEKMIHIDAYRLERGEELLSLGFKDLLSNPKNLILLEWPENVSGAIPESAQTINFKFIDEVTREISYEEKEG